MKKSKQEINYLDIVFRVSDRFTYEVDADGIVTVVEPQNHPIQRFFRRLRVQIPLARRIVMDAYSSCVFRQIDGKKTVREIGSLLEATFGESVQPTFERLPVFLTYIEEQKRYIEKVNF